MTKSPSSKQTASHEVGYGKPPKQSRFAKGTSGNPAGRPPNSVADQQSCAAFQGINALLIEELNREVSVREGEKTTMVATAQALIRNLCVLTMKGDRSALRLTFELLQKVEAEKNNSQIQEFKALVDYKQSWEIESERSEVRTERLKNVIPHPDDIIIDVRNGRARLEGPMTPEEKEELDAFLDSINDIVRFINELMVQRKQDPEDRSVRDVIRSLQKSFDEHNAALPKRYKITLENRLPIEEPED